MTIILFYYVITVNIQKTIKTVLLNFQAVRNEKFERFSDKVKWGMMGVNHVRLSVEAKKNLSPTRLLSVRVPEAFDSREQWSNCPSLRNIRDQSSCGKRRFIEAIVLFLPKGLDVYQAGPCRSTICSGDDALVTLSYHQNS